MPFTTRSLHFLRDLAHNNKKPWFEGHRDDYEAHIRAPMRALIEEMDVRFARFAAELTGDPKRSMFPDPSRYPLLAGQVAVQDARGVLVPTQRGRSSGGRRRRSGQRRIVLP